MQVLHQTLIAYHCSETLDAGELVKIVDENLFQTYQEQTLTPILKQPQYKQTSEILDLGPYPPTSWLDSVIFYVSGNDNIDKNQQVLENTYEIEESKEFKRNLKVFLPIFLPPDDSDRVFSIRFTDCNNFLTVLPQELEDVVFLPKHCITFEEF